MQPEAGSYWQKWLVTRGERVRLLQALQEEAIGNDRWDILQQLLQEQEELLGEIWQVAPPDLPLDVLAFLHEVNQENQRLQQKVEIRLTTLRAELAGVNRSRQALPHYHNDITGSFEDRAA